MKLVRWNPTAGPMLHDEVERMFDSFFGIDRRRQDLQSFDWTPRVNVEEADDRFVVTADLPGMKKEDIDIQLQENVLTIKGERKHEKEEKEKNYHIFERSCGTFQRAFTLPENVEMEKIDAEYRDGVLSIAIPKTEPAKPKEIRVKVK